MTMHQPPSIFALTCRALQRCAGQTAFKTSTVDWTGTATLDVIARAQRVLAAHHVTPGSCIALLTSNRAESWCFGVAAHGLGAMVTSLHSLGSLDAHRFQIEDSGSVVLVLDSSHYAARGAELQAALPDLTILTLGPASFGVDALAAVEAAGTSRLNDLSSPEAMATLNYTGGTTGRPKGVLRSSGAMAAMSASVLAEFELPRTPRYLAVAPISHVSGTNVVPTLLRGGTVHLLDRFDPDLLLSTIAKERINFTLMVPTMIYGLLDHPTLDRYDLSSLDLLLYGASAIAPSRLQEGIERLGQVFSQLYGQTECYPIATLPKRDHDLARPDLFAACGFPVASCQLRLLDDNNEEVAPGETGEICVRGPLVMAEYWRQPEQTAQAFASGWLHTGDIARADDEGRLYIVDRKKDMIVTGGFNVYPREVEDVIASHPSVANAAVVGIPDDKWGESVLALVVLRTGVALDANELIALVKTRKGSLHAPKQIAFVDTLPQTPLGKVDKKAIRASYWSDKTRQVG